MIITVDGKSIFECTKDELDQVFDTFKRARDIQIQRDAASFSIGKNVSFNHKGETVVGVVEKINQKTVGVLVGKFQHWKVSANLLTEVEIIHHEGKPAEEGN